uniref:Uncharacterized protein n=1 Tax=Anguilla anguilla TaxID=7936 RepID=A0A0E9QW41_ANGAN
MYLFHISGPVLQYSAHLMSSFKHQGCLLSLAF